jgi:diaminohydroxyphosphoribosylaminopyrimidine deaminase/5-amino-6-(5-phosphoribosylamino)uracil reductase
MPALVTDRDRLHLKRALELAEGGRGRVSPNPLVGAVIARDGEAIGEGFHPRVGEVHAEVAALADCASRGQDPAGATIYVTLEPCAHEGRQPPCTEAILAAGLSRVVVGSDDPSEKASGRGPELLRSRGVEVLFADGAEAEAARLINQPFRKYASTGLPHVSLKSALSLDGRTATGAGDSRWISGEASRTLVHRWRAEVDAVAIGIGTAIADDPLLTARGDAVDRQPLRVVFDSTARLPLTSKLVETIAEAPVALIAGPDAPSERVAALRGAGVDVIPVVGDPIERVGGGLSELGRRGVTSLLLEGGAGLAGSFVDARVLDELRLFIAPIVLGGAGARPLAAGTGAASIADATRALALEWSRSGEDLLVRARLREW